MAAFDPASAAGSTDRALILLRQADLFHEVLVVPEEPFMVHRAALPVTDGRHADCEALARGLNEFAVADGHGFVNVPVITPVTAVQVPEPKRIGCTLIVMSGAKTKRALRSSMCLSIPLLSCPSGQVTTMSFAWLSCSRSHFWLLKTSKSRVSKTLRFFSTAGACFS